MFDSGPSEPQTRSLGVQTRPAGSDTLFTASLQHLQPQRTSGASMCRVPLWGFLAPPVRCHCVFGQCGVGCSPTQSAEARAKQVAQTQRDQWKANAVDIWRCPTAAISSCPTAGRAIRGGGLHSFGFLPVSSGFPLATKVARPKNSSAEWMAPKTSQLYDLPNPKS